MIIDGRSLPNNSTIKTDVCIVGAGPAGITLAHEFVGAPFRACLLESGGLEPDQDTQSLAGGENVGHPYYPLDTARSRCFGGSPYRWLLEIGENRVGARLRPLDDIDFEQRDWIPYSGWPFTKAELDSYYRRAQAICQSGPFNYNVDDWEDPVTTPRLPFLNGRVTTGIFHLVPRDTFVYHYRDEISRVENVTTYLHATVVDIETAGSTQTVTRLRVACLGSKAFWVEAKFFILALGGIETPRLLLLSNKTQREGLGNQNDLVGRFFMEHPHLWSGYYFPANPTILQSCGLYRIHMAKGIPIEAKLTLSEEVLRQEKLLNYSVHLEPCTHPTSVRKSASEGVNSISLLLSSVRRGDVHDFNRHLSTFFPVINEFSIALYRKFMGAFEQFATTKECEAFRLNHISEQSPNRESRVTLSDERDALGQFRARLNWQLSALDVHSIVRAQEIIDVELRRAGLGQLRIDLRGNMPPPDLHGGWHHMGTTRMHTDPKEAVVNEKCQVYGISNLFVAGSSVFPTGGSANPTLTIVALSVRLADQIKKLMIRPSLQL